MIRCPHCGTTNQDENKFCSSCGQSLPIRTADGLLCPKCNTENESGAVFCDECGSRLRPAPLISAEIEPAPRDPIKGLSLPKKQTGQLGLSPTLSISQDIPEDVPQWLDKLLVNYGLTETKEESASDQERVTILPSIEKSKEEPSPEPEPTTLPKLQDDDRPIAIQEPVTPSPIAESEEPEGEVFADWLQTLRAETKDLQGTTEEPVEPPLTLEVQEPASPIQVPADEELPEWLRDLETIDVAEEPEPPTGQPEPAETAEELADWLRELDLPVEQETPPLAGDIPLPEEPAQIGGEELPDWLSELSAPDLKIEEFAPSGEQLPLPDEPSQASITDKVDDKELPSWLSELRKEGAEKEEPVSTVEPVSPPESESQPPDISEEIEKKPPESPVFVSPETAEPLLLEELETEAETEIPQLPPEYREKELEKEVSETDTSPPDWLTQPEAPDVTIEEGEVPIPNWLQGPVPADSEEQVKERERTSPDWLQDLQSDASSLAETEEQEHTEIPSWLHEMQPSETPKEVSPFLGEPLDEDFQVPAPEIKGEAKERAEGETETLASAEIPEWLLSLRPKEPGEEPVQEIELEEISGPLAGIKGVLPGEPIVSLPHLTRPERVAVEATTISGDLFAKVVAQPPVSVVSVPRQKRTRVVAGVQRALVYLLVLAAVLVPMLIDPIYGYLDAQDLRGGADLLYPLLDGQGVIALPAGSVVIVAFDYNPALAAELSLQGQAIIEHLMRRGVRIMAISLYPEGAALALDILDELAVTHNYIYGQDYIHLGYLPNQPASVRHFLDTGPVSNARQDYKNAELVSQYPIAQDVGDLAAVSLVIELTGDERTLRAWVEQMTARTDVPIAAGISASIAPYAQPYMNSGQLQALLVGLPGAAQYEALDKRTGPGIESLGSQVAAQAVIVLLILLGNLVHLVTRGGKK